MLMELLERLQGEDGFVGTDELQQLPQIISCTPDRCKQLTQCTAKEAQLGQDKELQERVGFFSFQKTEVESKCQRFPAEAFQSRGALC